MATAWFTDQIRKLMRGGAVMHNSTIELQKVIKNHSLNFFDIGNLRRCLSRIGLISYQHKCQKEKN